MFLYNVLLKAPDTLKVANDNTEKLFNIGSFFYNLTMEYLKTLAPLNKKNQDGVITELKITPSKTPMTALSIVIDPISKI